MSMLYTSKFARFYFVIFSCYLFSFIVRIVIVIVLCCVYGIDFKNDISLLPFLSATLDSLKLTVSDVTHVSFYSAESSPRLAYGCCCGSAHFGIKLEQ